MWELFLLLQVHLPESMVMQLIGKEGKDFLASCGDERALLTGTWLSSPGMCSEKGFRSRNERLLRSSPHMLSISGRTLGLVLKVLFHLGFSAEPSGMYPERLCVGRSWVLTWWARAHIQDVQFLPSRGLFLLHKEARGTGSMECWGWSRRDHACSARPALHLHSALT